MTFIDEAAKLLSEQKVIGWYQGNGEIGPRALGNRSILMDPRIPNGKEIINRIKKRENYRPFGASVLEEYSKYYFDMDWEDPYMLYFAPVIVSNMSSITHIDGTCRVQTVSKNNTLFRKLLERFYELTNCPVLLNTSLNIAGKPLAAHPKDAITLFNDSSIDAMIIGEQVIKK